ncbi:MAG: peptidoglycan DD-metalloendopeptidase family protein [Acidobacteriota bacterium]|nr:peptidoglycan DD-metalloendopeptidase family protein [Acidobacteriota bacterium]
MALKHHTIIFVPHAQAKLRKWRVTNRQLVIAAASILFLTAFAVFISWSYFTTAFDRDRLEGLRAENQDLQQVNESFAESIGELEGRLAEYEDRTRKLAILAGLETPGINNGDAGIGGLPSAPSDLEQLEFLDARVNVLDGTLSQVAERLDERARWISAMPTLLPVRGISTSAYGLRKDPVTGKRAFHQGLDISAAPGAEVRAPADGIITHSGWNGGLGKSVFLSHGYGIHTRYGHLSKLAVEEGTRVQRGEVIGYVGSTGRSTGYHLHYEVRVDGKPTNPMGYILDRVSWR